MEKPKILFICTANLNRSKTGEDLFKDKYPAKSAGTLCMEENGYTTPVSRELLEWADLVIVFESDHVEFLKKNYPNIEMKVINLEVPDIYPFHSVDLLEIIKERVPYVIDRIDKISPGFHNYSDI